MKISDLKNALSDKDTVVKLVALKALRSSCPCDSRIVSELLDALKDDEAGVRESAAWTLACIGAPEELAIPELIKLAFDENRDVRMIARYSINRIRNNVPVSFALREKTPL